MKTFTIYHNTQKSIPSFFKSIWKRGNVQGTFKIVQGQYNSYNEYQQDWNILGGINFIKSLKSNGIYVGWRYNVKSEVYEIAPLGKENGKIIFPKSYIEVNPKEAVRFSLYISSENSIILYSKKQIAFSEKIKNNPHSKIGFLTSPQLSNNLRYNDDVIIQLGYHL